MFLDFTTFKPLRNFIASFGRKAEPLSLAQISQRDSQKKDQGEAEASLPERKPTGTNPRAEAIKPTADRGPTKKSRSDLAKLSQDEYAEYLSQHGSPEGTSFYDELTTRPELRGLTSKDRVDYFNKNRQKSDSFVKDAEDLWTSLKKNKIDGISPIGESSSWNNFEVGKDTHVKDTDRNKSYATMRDFSSLTKARMESFLKHLRDSGYNGQVKFPGVGAKASLGFDNVVMHGATKKDAEIGEREAKKFFGDELTSTQQGVDVRGMSHTERLAEQSEKKYKRNNPKTAPANQAPKTQTLPPTSLQKPTPRPVQDQIPQSQWTDEKLPPITPYQPEVTTPTTAPQVAPVPNGSAGITQTPQNANPANPNEQPREGEVEWIEDPDHKMTPSEVSEKLGGKQGFKTDKGWSIHDPAKQGQEQQTPSGGTPTTPQAPEEQAKPEKPEPIDVNTVTPERIQEVQNSFHEFHRPPSEEEKQKIKAETNQQIDTFIDAVLEGRSNEATLPEMNQDEQVAFFISLFMAERAKMVAGIRITGRNRQKVAWAKELQRKIVTDLNNKANEYMNGAVKSISERKEKPVSFGGSLAELTRNDKPATDQKTPENYVREFSTAEGDKSKWSYNKRPYTQGIDVNDLTDEQLGFAGNIRNSMVNGIKEQSDKLENTNLAEDLNVEQGVTKEGLKTVGKTTVAIGNAPPSPNSNDSMVISFGLSSNPDQIKEALGKILKALDKKNLGSIMEIGSSTDIAMNSDNVRIKAKNWQELQDVHKIVEKQLQGISGADAHIEDNRYGLPEAETVDILADIKSQMKNNNGTFKLYGDGEEVKAGEDNKLSKVALVAKMLGSKVVSNEDGTFSLMSLLSKNSSAFNNGITSEDSDEQALQKIKDADEKDSQTPPPITDDPNSDVRNYLPDGWGKSRQQRTKAQNKPAKQPKPVAPPKTPPVSPQPELPVQPESVLPTTPGVSTYVPRVKDPADIETEISGITDWTSQEAKNLISDINATLQQSVSGYDEINSKYLQELGDGVNKKIEELGPEAMLSVPKVQVEKVQTLNQPNDFKNTKGFVKAGVRDVFEVQPVRQKAQEQKLTQLVQFFGKGRDKYKTKGEFDPLHDGIWIQGKNGEYFSGWCETKDLDGETTVFVSYDKSLMFTVPKGKDYIARAYVKKNPYLATNGTPIISNMESYYDKKEFLGDALPLTHSPDANNLSQFSVKYPELTNEHPDGRRVLSAILSYKHKLLSWMDADTRKMAIKDGFAEATIHLHNNSTPSSIKRMFLDSKSEVEGSSTKDFSMNDEQKNLISSISDEDFMKILSSVQVSRGNEESSKAKKFDEMRNKERLTSDNVEKYLKIKGLESHPILEYIAQRPSGIFKMPEKGDTYYREIMDLPAHIRNRLVGKKSDQAARKVTLDELAKDFSSGVHHNKGNERYTGTGGTENFLNDSIEAITDFYKENKTAEQSEIDYFDSLTKENTANARKLMSTPSSLTRDKIGDGDLYKINGQVYMAVNDPDSSDWVFRGADGDKQLHELFNGKDKIEVEGSIPKKSDAWDVIGQKLLKKTEAKQETNPSPTPYEDAGMEDILSQDNYDGSVPSQQDEHSDEYNPFEDTVTKDSEKSDKKIEGLTDFPTVEEQVPTQTEEEQYLQEQSDLAEAERQKLADEQEMQDELDWGDRRSSISNRRKRTAKKGIIEKCL